MRLRAHFDFSWMREDGGDVFIEGGHVAMHELKTLEWRQTEGVALLTLRRPAALNAINAEMLNELGDVFGRVTEDESVRVVLVTGAGDRAFAAGADIRELQEADAVSGQAVSEKGQRVFQQVEQCGKPVIACLNGVAFGGGLELALACTLRLASETAQVALPEARLGLIPGFGGIQRLVKLVGRSAALRIMLTAQTLKADEAYRLGLVDEVVAATELLPRAQQIAATIAGLAPLAIRMLLALVREEEELCAEDSYRREAERFGELCASADKREGLTAFLEKRRPMWTGK